jgi:8-oxo-dGTP diphosphatase
MTITALEVRVKMTGSSGYPPFAVTVDLVILTVGVEGLEALVIERGEEPFLGELALPGGFVRPDETLAAAASRELVEETGLRVAHLEQLASYGDPDRDPRMRVVTVAHLAMTQDPPAPTVGTDAAAAWWVPVRSLARKHLAFDHRKILRDGVERARAKLEYTTLATAFCPTEFTIAELRRVYEAIWGEELDPRNFSRKVLSSEDFIVPTDAITTRGGGRPARLYRAGQAIELLPPLRRPPIGSRIRGHG